MFLKALPAFDVHSRAGESPATTLNTRSLDFARDDNWGECLMVLALPSFARLGRWDICPYASRGGGESWGFPSSTTANLRVSFGAGATLGHRAYNFPVRHPNRKFCF